MNILQRDMDRNKRRLDDLCENILNDNDLKINAHKAYLKETEAQMVELKNSLTKLENDALKVRDDISNERMIEKRLEDERENLRRQDREMPIRLAELHGRENKVKNDLLLTLFHQHDNECLAPYYLKFAAIYVLTLNFHCDVQYWL